jgi:hypothetical protein
MDLKGEDFLIEGNSSIASTKSEKRLGRYIVKGGNRQLTNFDGVQSEPIIICGRPR